MEKLKAPKMYYVWNVALTLALAALALIPAAMAYNVRTFSGDHIPDWLAQAVSITILVAPSIAVFVIGMTRTFAVSDTAHAEAMKHAIILEAVACLFEIVAALITSGEWIAVGARITFLAGATLCSFAAIGLALVSNGYYRMIIADNQQALAQAEQQRELAKIEAASELAHRQAIAQAELELMQSDEMRREIQEGFRQKVRLDIERDAGRRLYTRPVMGESERQSFSTNGHKLTEPPKA